MKAVPVVFLLSLAASCCASQFELNVPELKYSDSKPGDLFRPPAMALQPGPKPELKGVKAYKTAVKPRMVLKDGIVLPSTAIDYKLKVEAADPEIDQAMVHIPSEKTNCLTSR